MTHDSDNQLQLIDRATLTSLVRQALGSETAEVTDWDTEEIHEGVGAHSGAASTIRRLSGSARDHGDELAWSLILKSLRPRGKGRQPSDWNYWRREADVYRSGWLDDLPGGLAAPRCFGVDDRPDGACWIWMEDVADHFGSADDNGPKWPLEQYGVAARHLGRFNGAYLTGQRSIPSEPWLSTGFFRGGIADAVPAVALLDDVDEHPLARRALPPEGIEMLQSLWAEREAFLGALDAMPQTVCHFDFFHSNLFTRYTGGGGEEILVIDWAHVSYGALGVDLMPLWAHGSLKVRYSRAQEFDDIVLEGYLKGLRDVGWDADPQQVWLACGIHLSLNILVYWLGQRMPEFLNERLHLTPEQTVGRSIEQDADDFRAMLGLVRDPRYWDVIEQARQMLGLA